MFRVFFILFLTLSAMALVGAAQETENIRTLLNQLNQPSTTDRAARRILAAASRESEARRYLTKKLPEIIERPQTDAVWLNAVRLAGKLKINEAIPALEEALPRGRLGGPMNTTFATQMRLDDDAVAKALSQIGDPAIPAVESLLQSDKPEVRRRGVLIPRNINTPAGKKALEEQLPRESDPAIKELIEVGLRP